VFRFSIAFVILCTTITFACTISAYPDSNNARNRHNSVDFFSVDLNSIPGTYCWCPPTITEFFKLPNGDEILIIRSMSSSEEKARMHILHH
jgi:hypothetical protein